MPIQFDKFDQQKVDRLKSHLEAMASKGKAKFYEIYVDSLKAVPKTDEPKDFEGYEDYMTADTNQIKVVIYSSELSPRNEQYVFAMKAQNQQEAFDIGLNGIAFRSFSKGELNDIKEKRDKKSADTLEIQELNKEINELNGILDERDSYILQLENGVEKAKANGNKIGKIHLGDILSHAFEGMVRRNTHLIAGIPALNGIAEIIDLDTEKSANPTTEPEVEVTFKKKEEAESPSPLTDQEKQFVELFKEIHSHFTENEMKQLIEMLDRLSQDKTQIVPILDLLKESPKTK